MEKVIFIGFYFLKTFSIIIYDIFRGIILVWYKLLAIFFLTFLPDIIQKGQTIFLLLLIYLLLHLKFRPNLSKTLNKSEIFSTFVLILILWIKMFSYSVINDQNEVLEIFLLILEYICIFILVISQTSFLFYLTIYNFLQQQKLLYLERILSKKKSNKIVVLERIL